MPLILTSPPAAEPVTLAEAKAFLRVDHADEDALIASLALAARMHLERVLSLAMISQGWNLMLDRWPAGPVPLPLYPVWSISAVTVFAADGTPATVPLGDVDLDSASRPIRLARKKTGIGWPPPGRSINGIEIAFVAGFGAAAASVPEPLRQAVLRLTADWYETRATVAVGDGGSPLPSSVSTLVSPYRARRVK
jgi:uncharacterized phiE125 gp8 family phage protein